MCCQNILRASHGQTDIALTVPAPHVPLCDGGLFPHKDLIKKYRYLRHEPPSCPHRTDQHSDGNRARQDMNKSFLELYKANRLIYSNLSFLAFLLPSQGYFPYRRHSPYERARAPDSEPALAHRSQTPCRSPSPYDSRSQSLRFLEQRSHYVSNGPDIHSVHYQ